MMTVMVTVTMMTTDDDDDDDVFVHSQSPYSNILVSRIIRFIFVTLIIFFFCTDDAIYF
jgi:hypothetical protein